MRKFLIILLVFVNAGCVSVSIPRYLEDTSNSKKQYYASSEETLEAAKEVLEDHGWKITDSVDPAIYEQNGTFDATKGKQVLLFTETRQTSMILFSRYSNLNVFIRPLDNSSTEVEIRYYSATPLFFKTFKSTKNDRLINKMFDQIGQALEK